MEPSSVTPAFFCTSNAGKARELRAALGIPDVFCVGDLSESQRKRFSEPEEDGDSFCLNGIKKLAAALRVFVDDKGQPFAAGEADKERVPRLVIVDDSGLCVPALGHEPGVHSAYFAGRPRDDQRNLERLADLVGQRGVLQDSTGSTNSGSSGERRLPGFFVCSLQVFDLGRFLSAPPSASERLEVLRALFALAEHTATSGFAGAEWEKALFERAFESRLTAVSPEVLDSRWGPCLAPFLRVCYGFVWGEVSSCAQRLLPGEGHGYDPVFYPATKPTHSFASISLEEKNTLSHRGRAAVELKTQLRTQLKKDQVTS